MIPRTEVTAVEFRTTVKEMINTFIETGYSKIPVYRDSIDNVVGYVSSKELYKGPETIKSRLIPLSIVPESMQVNKLLRLLIKEHKTMALVVDEYGGTSGIITLEDIMEEIFGEIEDEHDVPEFIEKQVNENEYIFSGRLEIDYLNEKYNMDLPESDEYDTLAGLIIFKSGDIPKVNSTISTGEYEMKILKVSQTRVELVNVKKTSNR
jgi:CBS domain containing-hemolysin-like protein